MAKEDETLLSLVIKKTGDLVIRTKSFSHAPSKKFLDNLITELEERTTSSDPETQAKIREEVSAIAIKIRRELDIRLPQPD